MPNLRCGCGEPIDCATHLHLSHIHPHWTDELLRDQNARRAGKYLSGVGVPTVVNTNVKKPVFSSGGSISPTIFTPQGPVLYDALKKYARGKGER